MGQRRTVLLLPGQGAQRERMAAGLYGAEPVFTAYLDAFFAGYGSGGPGLRRAWSGESPDPGLGDALVAQPLLFAIGYALGRAVQSWGAGLDVLIGHSVGELAAACLAGVFDPDDVGPVARARVEALRAVGPGRMIAVAAAADEVAGLVCDDRVAVAAVNGPRRTVLAGPVAAVAGTETRLRTAGITARLVRSSHAFHSPAMRPAAARFAASLVPRRPAALDLLSCRTTGPVRPEEATRAAFWADQLAEPVLYWPTLRALLDARGTDPGLVLLDAGPDGALTAPARRHPAVRTGASAVVPLLSATGADAEAFAAARRYVAR